MAIGAEAVLRAGQDLSWLHLRLHAATDCRYARWEALLTGGPADPPPACQQLMRGGTGCDRRAAHSCHPKESPHTEHIPSGHQAPGQPAPWWDEQRSSGWANTGTIAAADGSPLHIGR
ncbi:hypothetical protein ACWEQN_45860 [Streptomyces sp. NPDC004129]